MKLKPKWDFSHCNRSKPDRKNRKLINCDNSKFTKLSEEARDFLKKFITSFLGKEGPEEIVEAIIKLNFCYLNKNGTQKSYKLASMSLLPWMFISGF